MAVAKVASKSVVAKKVPAAKVVPAKSKSTQAKIRVPVIRNLQPKRG